MSPAGAGEQSARAASYSARSCARAGQVRVLRCRRRVLARGRAAPLLLMTVTIRAPNCPAPAASINACRLLPSPEISTATRVAGRVTSVVGEARGGGAAIIRDSRRHGHTQESLSLLRRLSPALCSLRRARLGRQQGGAAARDLYTVTVAPDPAAADQREAATQAAMARLLLRVTGSRSAPIDPGPCSR